MQNMASGSVRPCGQLKGDSELDTHSKGCPIYTHAHIYTQTLTQTCMFMGGNNWKDIQQRAQLCGSRAKPTFYN